MGSKPSNFGCNGNQDGSIRSLVPSVRRATDWNNPQRVFGPLVVLDTIGFRNEIDCFQELLQRLSQSCWVEGRNSDRDGRIQRCESQIVSLAVTLPRAVPDTNGMTTNSPWTGSCWPCKECTSGLRLPCLPSYFPQRSVIAEHH